MALGLSSLWAHHTYYLLKNSFFDYSCGLWGGVKTLWFCDSHENALLSFLLKEHNWLTTQLLPLCAHHHLCPEAIPSRTPNPGLLPTNAWARWGYNTGTFQQTMGLLQWVTLTGGHPLGLTGTFCDLGLFLLSAPSFPLSLPYGLKAVVTLSGSLLVVASHQDSTQWAPPPRTVGNTVPSHTVPGSGCVTSRTWHK